MTSDGTNVEFQIDLPQHAVVAVTLEFAVAEAAGLA